MLIITGYAGVFSVGADLDSLGSLDAPSAREFSIRGQSLMSRVTKPDAITMAAIDGHCLGGGLDLALSCDLRYASPRSTFQHPGVKRGIITGWGGNVRLPALIGADNARGYFVTAERIGAEEAKRLGLLNDICDSPLEKACQLATRIAATWSPEGILAAKRACQMELGDR